jgi:hypothetical protein
MENYPELLNKQVQSYEENGLNWNGIAKKIFPSLSSSFSLMLKARNNILHVCKPICSKAVENLKLDFDVIFVIYVGIGCGAGWATTYKGQPAVLLGLENIAEERWHTQRKLKGLISHEIGHLAHINWRNEWQIFEKVEDPLFQLYGEGFAQRCEHIILRKETWHVAKDREWLSWCKRHKGWLAKEFLKRVEKQASLKDFFGSWFSIQGKKQTGYFLGHEFIRELEKNYSLREIALFKMDKVRKLGMHFLKTAGKQKI